MEIKKGIGVSPGVVIGTAVVLDAEDLVIPRRTVAPEQAEAEAQRLGQAIANTVVDLTKLRDQVTEQHGKVSSEGRPVAACIGLGVPALGLSVGRRAAAAQIGLIHHIVVEQRKLVQQLQGRGGPDRFRMPRPVDLTAGGDISPMAHGGPDPLASLV